MLLSRLLLDGRRATRDDLVYCVWHDAEGQRIVAAGLLGEAFDAPDAFISINDFLREDWYDADEPKGGLTWL